MYASTNFKSKKALKEAVAKGPQACFQPGPFGPDVADGVHCCEGPKIEVMCLMMRPDYG